MGARLRLGDVFAEIEPQQLGVEWHHPIPRGSLELGWLLAILALGHVSPDREQWRVDVEDEVLALKPAGFRAGEDDVGQQQRP